MESERAMRLACLSILGLLWVGTLPACAPFDASSAEASSVAAHEGGPAAPSFVSALGRLEPGGGVHRVAGPSGLPPVVGTLLVEEGAWVERRQLLAVLDTHPVRVAEVERVVAEVAYAEAELDRSADLHERNALSDAQREEAELGLATAVARLERARAELALAEIRAPIKGEILAVHARPGERIGEKGLLEIGRTDRMVAIAEVYETDVFGVRVGAAATVTSEALPKAIVGRVARVGRKVAKLDVLGTDPAAKTDARIVEVEIALEPSDEAGALTFLQVEARIER